MNRTNLSSIHGLWIAAVLALSASCSENPSPIMEPLTLGALEAAERQWEAHGSDSYHLVVRVEASRMSPTVLDVVVRDGKTAGIKRDGEPVSIDPNVS
jgi:hypothetical protein